VRIVGKDGNTITSVSDWYTGAPPKGGEAHWVPGRSARELASAWCGSHGPCVPAEIEQLLRSHPDLVDVVVERAVPEHQIRFDDLRGEPRNADLAIEARDRDGVVAITIEGKADETFDRQVSSVLHSAVERLAADERTGAVSRVEALSAALLPRWREGMPHLGELRYQLLTGIAGTLAWARELGATRAVFVVHEFVTDHTRDDKHAQNASDLTLFVKRLSDGVIGDLSAGVLVGPVRVPGVERIPTLPLYIGKAVRTTRRMQS
jgi:uncharacterized protein DUF6946